MLLWLTGSVPLVVTIVCFNLLGSPKENLEPAEVVHKHLESIGGADALAKNTSYTIVGTCKFNFRGRGIGQHVRSQYVQVISAQMGSTDKDSARQSKLRYEIDEEFSEFRKEGALTLPHNYKLRLNLDDYSGTNQYEWTLTLTQFAFNRAIAAESFNVDAYKPGM